MVAHIVLDVAVSHGGVGLDPQRQGVVLREVSVDERKVGVYYVGVVVVAEEAPYAGLAVADGAEVQRTIGLAEAEVFVGTVVPAHLTCK